MTRWHCAAPAKINLALHVTGQREDGYHLLETLAVFTAMGDHVSVEAVAGAAPAEGVSLQMDGPQAGLLEQAGADADNLVTRSCAKLLEAAGVRDHWLAAMLTKHLPVASGIGGGSADAAAAMIAAADALGLPEDFDLEAIALKLGADVPMCLQSRALIARGIGEVIEPVEGLPQLHLLLVNPRVAVTTPEVFKALASRANAPLAALPRITTCGELAGWLARQRNDLEAPARLLAPVIGEVVGAIAAQTGCLLSRMSGSGATCFGIFPDRHSCENAARAIGSLHPQWWVTATQTQDAPHPYRKRPWQE